MRAGDYWHWLLLLHLRVGFVRLHGLFRQSVWSRQSVLPGRWKEVFNSDASVYGGGDFGNSGATLVGGDTAVNLPAAGYVVFKRVE